MNILVNFGEALAWLKADSHHRAARAGWNGKGMWIAYSPGVLALPAERFWSGANKEYAITQGYRATVLPCLTMKTATGEILMGWLASQTDMLAEDWELLSPLLSKPAVE
jgi:hypothetical protein